MLLTANTRGACSSRRAKQLAGLYPGFHPGNRLEPGICGILARSAGPPESVTQTPEDRRAADSAVEVLGAAATPAGFTVRTLKLLVTATVTDRLGTGGSPSPGPGPGVTGRLQGQWPGTRRPPRRHREGACEELDLPGQLTL